MRKKEKDHFIATTIYLPPDLKTEIKEYQKKKGYGTMSEVFRRGFFVLKKIYPLERGSSQSEEKGLFDRLASIETKLQELKSEKELRNKELEALERRQKLLERANATIDGESLPNEDEIEQEIIEILGELGPMKDFVLMNHLGDKYERGIIWSKIMDLQHNNKVLFKEGKLYKNE
jgi:hypothetical protein